MSRDTLGYVCGRRATDTGSDVEPRSGSRAGCFGGRCSRFRKGRRCHQSLCANTGWLLRRRSCKQAPCTEGSQLGFGRGRSYTDLSGSRQPIRHQQRRRYGRILARGAARLMGSEALLQGGADTVMAGQNASWTAVRPPRIRPLPATPCQSARDYASYRATRSTTPRSPSFTNSTLACRLAANREKAIVSVRFGS